MSAGAAAGALPEPASSRAAHPVPPCPLRTILTSNDPPENGKTGFLKFLELRGNARSITSRRPPPTRRPPGARRARHRPAALTPEEPHPCHIVPVSAGRIRPEPGG